MFLHSTSVVTKNSSVGFACFEQRESWGGVHICASLLWRKPKSSFVFAWLEFRTAQLLQLFCSNFTSLWVILPFADVAWYSRFQKFGSTGSFLKGPSDRWPIYRALHLCPTHRPLCHSHRFIKMSVKETVVFEDVPQNTCFSIMDPCPPSGWAYISM